MYEYIIVVSYVLCIYIVITNLTNFKINIRELVIRIFVTGVLSVGAFEIAEYLQDFPMIIGGSLYVYKNTKNIKHSLIIIVASIVLLTLLDYAVSSLYFILFSLSGNLEFGIFFIAIKLICMFLVSNIFGEILRRANLKLISVLLNFRFLVLITISIVLICIRSFLSLLFLDISINNRYVMHIDVFMFSILCIMLITIIYIVFKGITKEAELKRKQVSFDILQNYTTKIENMYSDIRSFKHDYVNILSSIVGYIDEKDMSGLEEYFHSNILPLSYDMRKSDAEMALLKNIKIIEVKGLLYSKLIRAQEMGMKVFIDIKEIIEQIDMHIIDICRALGILLDNAIEAGENNVNHTIRVAFIRAGTTITMIISNSCNEDSSLIHKINRKKYSSKGENRGIGLSNLNNILNNYKYVTLDTRIENGEFVQEIVIENKVS